MLQELTLIGRLGRDAIVRTTPNGKEFIALTVASDGYVKGKVVTSWYDVISFEVEKYRNRMPYLTKGSAIVVVGDLYAEVEIGTDNVPRCRRTVMAHTINFLKTSNPEASTGTISEGGAPVQQAAPRVVQGYNLEGVTMGVRQQPVQQVPQQPVQQVPQQPVQQPAQRVAPQPQVVQQVPQQHAQQPVQQQAYVAPDASLQYNVDDSNDYDLPF